MQNNLVVGPKTYKGSTYVWMYKKCRSGNCKCSKEIIRDLDTFNRLFHFIKELKQNKFSHGTICFTFQQDLLDFLHLQLLCTLELICQVQDNGHRWIRCNVYLRCDTAGQKHFSFWDEAVLDKRCIEWVNDIITKDIAKFTYKPYHDL